MGLENHPVAGLSWRIHLTHSTWNMQRENSLYIYIYTYTHILNRQKQRLFYSWFWLMSLVSPTRIHAPCQKNSEMRTVQGAVDFQGSETTRICRHVEPQIVLAWRGPARAWNGDPWGSHDGGSLEIPPGCGADFHHLRVKGMWSSTENLGWVKPPNVCESIFLNTGAHWCSILAAREGLRWFLVLTAC